MPEDVLKSCRYDPNTDNQCPVFQLKTVVLGTGTPTFNDIAIKVHTNTDSFQTEHKGFEFHQSICDEVFVYYAFVSGSLCCTNRKRVSKFSSSRSQRCDFSCSKRKS